MSSDISRQRFDHSRNFAGVLMQQGRVLLDADWNEWLEIIDRRLRAEALDTFGECAVPKQTPDGFRITLSGGELAIGPGRIYVHGHLAENHGRDPKEWNPLLAELTGTDPVPLNEQPYLPDPALLQPPSPTSGGPHLVYLDVWQREVTPLQAPDLIESAVGVDSTCRRQTVWQVKVLPDVGDGATCGAELDAWDELTRPGAGRLSTGTFNAPDDPDPCLIPPSGGYKGLENRLYRVEVHSVDLATGEATFKWARHNASVASAVHSINGEDVVVELVGRDAELRFSIGDWVEITDDARELAGLPGYMRKIKNVEDATRVVTIDGSLPAGAFPSGSGGTTLPERHTRLRRWDQKGQVRSVDGTVHHDLNAAEGDELKKGVIPADPAGPALLLEDGVQVQFSLDPDIPGGRFRAGDYWVFIARTADASVEVLESAPPRGVHHHYCRLALVTFPDTVTDCRTLWPPEGEGEGHGCDCTVCVSAEDHNSGVLTLQMAVDQVAATGGDVCLGAGVFNVSDGPVRVRDAGSIRIRGRGWRTVLAHTGEGPAMTVSASLGVTIERLAFLTNRRVAGTADLALENSADVAVEDCYFLQAGKAAGVRAAIALGGALVHTRIRNNVVFAGAGVVNGEAEQSEMDTTARRHRPLMTLGLRIDNNQLLCERAGIRLAGLCMHLGDTSIRDNFIHRASSGAVFLNGVLPSELFGGSRLDIAGNSLRCAGHGITTGVDNTRIHGNDLGADDERSGHGIIVEQGILGRPIRGLRVFDNRIAGLDGDGILIRGPVQSALIKSNEIERMQGGGVVMDEEARADELVVEGNRLNEVLHVAAGLNDAAPFLAAIHLVRVETADVLNNVLVGTAATVATGPGLAGIRLTACARSRVEGNRVQGLGPDHLPVESADAIAVIGLHEHASIVGNQVSRTVSSDRGRVAQWRALRIYAGEAASTDGARTAAFAETFGRLMLVRFQEIEAVITENDVQFRALPVEFAMVRGNRFSAIGSTAAVEVRSPGRVQLSDNRCDLLPPVKSTVVFVRARGIVFGGNSVDAERGEQDVVQLEVPAVQRDVLPVTVLGNIVSGVIRINGVVLSDPWKALNVQMA